MWKQNKRFSRTKSGRKRRTTRKRIQTIDESLGNIMTPQRANGMSKQKASGNGSWQKSNNIKRNGHVLFTRLSIFHLLFVTLNVHLNACLVFYFCFSVWVCVCFSSCDRHFHLHAAAFYSIFHFLCFHLPCGFKKCDQYRCNGGSCSQIIGP